MRVGWDEVELNGRAQWVSRRGAEHAPLLLFVHGGPGASEFPQRRRYLRDLERDWLVVDWDQPAPGAPTGRRNLGGPVAGNARR